ncbi:2-phosphoxylose phosphatase 1 [Scaptodrosophila lebanonensis]|uniref:2-phosphoxylose phosphatase 1 n=1 Tax=Drosophila lebanonensis TaxID=7225 RepID=A0A6J2U8K1_DROLE|nr:2-phosphoxylose phosphatase 1 [Scaptodrosophila lebanonensis]
MLLLKELTRLTTQHRTFYCYMFLSIWIFLLIAGMYRYMGNSENSGSLGSGYGHSGTISSGSGSSGGASSEAAHRFMKYRERCGPLLTRIEDGGILEGWKLQGVLLVIRHGDRGPMSHVRTNGVHCGVASDNLVNRYRSFLYNSSSSASGSNHMYWNKVGPFHGFPLLPATERACLLGQLTYKGISQLLHVGDIMHQIYAHPLGLLLKSNPNKLGGSAQESTPHTLLNSDEVVVYTTRYRRTFQSALALLFSFLPPDKWLSVNVRESHSMAFCFSDCSCAQSMLLRKGLADMGDRELKKRPDVLGVMQWIGGTLLQHTPNGITNPFEVLDAMLTVICHDAALPCRKQKIRGNDAQAASTHKAQELVDVINIDQDDTVANLMDVGGGAGAGAVADVADSSEGDGNAASEHPGPIEGCVEAPHVETLMSFVDVLSQRTADHAFYKRTGLLKAYGLIRHIVSYILKMISGDRTKFVLYSGHDTTMQYLTAALGIHAGYTIPYASRLAFEVYSSESEAHTDYYFRVVYNGKDVTQQIDFCEGGKSLRVTRDSRGNKADLCPIENIIRFLHEDYFAPVNATNFKDACATGTPKANEF